MQVVKITEIRLDSHNVGLEDRNRKILGELGCGRKRSLFTGKAASRHDNIIYLHCLLLLYLNTFCFSLFKVFLIKSEI